MPSGALLTGTVDLTADAIILEVTTALAAASQTPSTPTPTPTATNTRFFTPTQISILATIPPRGTESITPSRPPSDTMTFTPSNTPLPSNTPTPSSTSTSTFTPPPTLPPQGAQGAQNLLALASSQPDPLWDSEQFAPSDEGDVWRLGIGSLTEGGTIFIAPPVDALESAYGNDPASRITVAEAELSLIVYNPPLLAEDGVYFGLLLQSADEPLSAGVQVNLVNLSSIRLSQRVGETLETISQRSDDARNLRIRLERNVDAETITIYVDNQQLGNPIPFAGDEPVIPVLYVRQGGVIVHVLSWSVTLR